MTKKKKGRKKQISFQLSLYVEDKYGEEFWKRSVKELKTQKIIPRHLRIDVKN